VKGENVLDSTSASNENQGGNEQQVVVSGGPVLLNGVLNNPVGALAIVVFPYDGMAANENILGALQTLARTFQQAGLGTLMVNLLTPEDEALDRSTGFFRENVEVLHQRVIGIANWLIDNTYIEGISMGYVGAGVSGAAILAAAAARPDAFQGIVAVAPRTDLVSSDLPQVAAPTLLIAGEQDTAAVDMGRKALGALMSDTTLDVVAQAKERGAGNRMEIIQGISNVFENDQALQTVGKEATDWFKKYLF
jgi:putative phosphoribosyl transferase